MPIYENTYQTWSGERRGPFFRWMAIPKFTLMDYFGNRTFIWLFSMAWFQFIIRLAYIYLLVNTEFLKMMQMPVSALPPVEAFFFKNTIDLQIPFCVAFAFMLGSNLISRDLAHNALVLFVSKPISRWEYFFGKFSIVFFLSLLLTWFQGAFLYLLQVAVSPAHSKWRIYFWEDYAGIFWQMTLYCLVIATSLSLLILAASSLVKNGRMAGLIFAIYIIGTIIVGLIVKNVTEMPDLWAISPWTSIKDIGYYLFDLDKKYANVSLSAAWIGILSNWALCGIIIKWRMSNASKYGR
jgi:ABC-type transport system involved in multi-copper enzyme maturation permease subunit